MRWCKAWALDNLEPITYTEFIDLDPRTMDDLDRTIWRERLKNNQCSQLSRFRYSGEASAVYVNRHKLYRFRNRMPVPYDGGTAPRFVHGTVAAFKFFWGCVGVLAHSERLVPSFNAEHRKLHRGQPYALSSIIQITRHRRRRLPGLGLRTLRTSRVSFKNAELAPQG